MWGGQLELQALSAALRRCIKVYSVGMPLIQFGEEFAGGGAAPPPLHLAYLKHYFGLGEHYNAVLAGGSGAAEAGEEEPEAGGGEPDGGDDGEEE